MILVISDNGDASTNEVLDYFKLYSIDFIRINETTISYVYDLDLKNDYINFILRLRDEFYKDYDLNFSEIDGVWYRRGKINLYNPVFKDSYFSQSENIKIQKYLYSEISDLEFYINYLLKYFKPCINSYLDNTSNKNKLLSLLLAQKNGLLIPPTFISNFTERIISKITDDSHITKDIKDCRVSFESLYHFISGKTNLIKKDHVSVFDNVSFPNLIQTNILKSYEIRTFYLKGNFYSTAIFSQNDETTKIDFRNYNFKRMNRVVPYKLPFEIESKLDKFMVEMEINSGSIDLIRSIQGEYYFLEVNPVGQYSQASIPGQYNISKLIAQFFKTITDERKSNIEATLRQYNRV